MNRRRSSRIAGLAAGFKNPKYAEEASSVAGAISDLTSQFEASIMDEEEAPPPHLPVETLQAIGTGHCKMPSSMVSEAALNYNSADDSE